MNFKLVRPSAIEMAPADISRFAMDPPDLKPTDYLERYALNTSRQLIAESL